MIGAAIFGGGFVSASGASAVNFPSVNMKETFQG
jgi:hypothetical protein